VDICDDFENIENVEILVDKIVQDLVEADNVQGDDLNDIGKADAEAIDSIEVLAKWHSNGGSDSLAAASNTNEGPSLSVQSVCNDGSAVDKEKHVSIGLEFKEARTGVGVTEPTVSVRVSTVDGKSNQKKRSNKYTSCSLGNSGPWSVDWLQNIQQGDIGLISSKNKRLKKVGKENGGSGGSALKKNVKKKTGDVLRHPVLTLKRVARLSSKDREEVMKVLRDSKFLKELNQKIRNQRRQRERVTRSLEEASHHSLNESSSMVSVNNDWKNWVALNGSDVSKAADVQYIGKTIGVSFKGSCHNKFSVLNRQKSAESGPELTTVVDGGVEEDEGV